LPINLNNTLVIQVLVTPIANEAARLATSNLRVRMAGDTLLVTVKTRKGHERGRHRVLGQRRASLVELPWRRPSCHRDGAIFTLANPAQGSSQAQTEIADLQQRMRIGSDALQGAGDGGRGHLSGRLHRSPINYFAPILPRRTAISRRMRPPCSARRSDADVHPNAHTATPATPFERREKAAPDERPNTTGVRPRTALSS
jgi:hypothetical protein